MWASRWWLWFRFELLGHSMNIPYIFLVLYLYMVWKYVFRDPGRFPNATITQKIVHSLALFLLAWVCWGWVSTMIWILVHPHQWVEYLIHKAKPYPVSVDAVFQLLGSIVGVVGTLCCYFTLRGYDKARRILLLLLPLVYLIDLYVQFVKYVQVHNVPPVPVMVLGALFESVPFLLILIFYRHPKVIESLFTGVGSHEQVSEERK
jgi:hypothetical protein